MSGSYDPNQMASDALRGFPPPRHTGVESFASEEGVRMLAAELEAALDRANGLEKSKEDAADLREQNKALLEAVDDLKRRAKNFAAEAQAFIGYAETA